MVSLYSQKTILMIEDDPAEADLVRLSCTDLLENTTLIVLADGEQAIRYIDESRHLHAKVPDLIFLDLNLPRVDGLEVLRHLKSNSYMKVVPVIVFSTTQDPVDIRAVYDQMASCFISKPRDLDDYLRVCRSIHRFWFKTATLVQAGRGSIRAPT
jgi:two-component system, chemotaxis family, response regulator Rcp1